MFRVLLLLPLLAACHTLPTTPLAVLAGVEAASVVVFGRDVGDIVVSAASGRDCSIVRLDRGKSYCRPLDPPPARPAFCTRSLAGVDCWSNPEALPAHTREVADGPRVLTPEQEARRTRKWPF